MTGDVTLGNLYRMLSNNYFPFLANSSKFKGATSGTTTLAASAVASGTLTLPAATDTLVGKATTDTLTNKTFDQTSVGTVIGAVASGSYSQASNTTLAVVSGMSVNVSSSGTYAFEIYLATTNNNTGGIKLDLNGGTATATSLLADTWVYNTTTITAEGNITALASALVSAAVAATAVLVKGCLVVNAFGTVKLRAAQSVSNATALTIANNSYMKFTRIA